MMVVAIDINVKNLLALLDDESYNCPTIPNHICWNKGYPIFETGMKNLQKYLLGCSILTVPRAVVRLKYEFMPPNFFLEELINPIANRPFLLFYLLLYNLLK